MQVVRSHRVGGLIIAHVRIAQLACNKFELAQGSVILFTAVETMVLVNNLAQHKILPRPACHANGTARHIAKGASLQTLLPNRLSKDRHRPLVDSNNSQVLYSLRRWVAAACSACSSRTMRPTPGTWWQHCSTKLFSSCS